MVKGTAFVNLRDCLLARFGSEGLDAFMARRSPHDVQELRSVLAVGWYDLALETRLLEAVDRELGDGQGTLLAEFGPVYAERDLTRVHRLFLRLANPAYVLEKAGEYWGRFYNTGTWHVERLGDTGARGTLSGFSTYAGYCQFLTAYLRRLFELAGARSVVVEHPACKHRGRAACVFVARWA
ncbi:MAG TPA: hypothetical protein VFS43_07305 [Polyangiaceae bacterium]|nr:hypothetical protein [Polyangiaceae bacterium]